MILGGIDGAGKSTLAREIAEGPSTAHIVARAIAGRVTVFDTDTLPAVTEALRPLL